MASRNTSFQDLPIFKGPVCLVCTSRDGIFESDQNALDQLKQINSRLVVVTIAGLCRTGKSYLMNCLAGNKNGFQVGNTLKTVTKGIWALCKIHPKKDNTVILMLDTEGLGDSAKGDIDHDNRLIILATLLCNVLVYNMRSVFSQDIIEKLTYPRVQINVSVRKRICAESIFVYNRFITELSKHISFKNKNEDVLNDRQLDLILPTFVLCLRDFSLTMQIDDKEYTPDEYLEKCLELKQGNERFNRPRESIKNYFPDRKCFVFDFPGDRKVISRLEAADKSDLSKTFLQDIEAFVDYIHTCRPKLIMSSKPVNGAMITSLLETYLKAIQAGDVPDVDDAIMVVANKENERLAGAAVERFKECVERSIDRLPVIKTDELSDLYNEFKQESLKQYKLEAVFDTAIHQQRAIDAMDKIWEEFKSKNSKKIREYCERELNQIYKRIIGKNTRKNKYSVPGGYLLYQKDIEKVTMKYKKNMKDTDQFAAMDVLQNFMEKETENRNKIELEDRRLTEEETKEAERRRHVERKNDSFVLKKWREEDEQTQKKILELIEEKELLQTELNEAKEQIKDLQMQIAKLSESGCCNQCCLM